MLFFCGGVDFCAWALVDLVALRVELALEFDDVGVLQLLSLSRTHTFTHSLSLSHTRPPSLSLFLIHTLSLPHTQPHTHTQGVLAYVYLVALRVELALELDDVGVLQLLHDLQLPVLPIGGKGGFIKLKDTTKLTNTIAGMKPRGERGPDVRLSQPATDSAPETPKPNPCNSNPKPHATNASESDQVCSIQGCLIQNMLNSTKYFEFKIC